MSLHVSWMRRILAPRSYLLICPWYQAEMEIERDAIYYEQLARVARLKASATDDPFLTVRLRNAAIRHERMRKLRLDSA